MSAGAVASQVLNNTDATTQLNETNHCGVIGGASKWFGLHSTDGGVLQLDTLGSSIDTVLAVYTNDAANPLGSGVKLVTCDRNGAPDGIRSLVKLAAAPAGDYLVAVDSVRNEPGVISLNWRLGVLPVSTNAPLAPLVRHVAPPKYCSLFAVSRSTDGEGPGFADRAALVIETRRAARLTLAF